MCWVSPSDPQPPPPSCHPMDPSKVFVSIIARRRWWMEGLHVGKRRSLNGGRVGSSNLWLWKLSISEARISSSILRFISFSWVLVWILKPKPHLVWLAQTLDILSLVSHLSYLRNVWHMQDAQLHKSKLEHRIFQEHRSCHPSDGVSINKTECPSNQWGATRKPYL